MTAPSAPSGPSTTQTTTQTAPQTASGVPVGVPCSRCARPLVASSQARGTFSGRWRHESCEDEPVPGEADLESLADLAMRTHPWPRLVFLRTQLTQVHEELDALRSPDVPRQGGPPPIEGGRHKRPSQESDLRAQVEEIEAAIAAERTWKAQRIAVQWSHGVRQR